MKANLLDKLIGAFAPRAALRRLQARAALGVVMRHYEAAQPGRRTSGWNRNRGDANAVAGVALHELRIHARDLVRNNGWGKKAQRVIANHTVGWGIVPKPKGASEEASAKLMKLWDDWAGTTECESERRHTFYGIQHLAMKAIASDGEVLIRRRLRRVEDGLTVPLQLQVLEADWLDTSKDNEIGKAGGPIVRGVEFDKLGRRAAYWLFDAHPGGNGAIGVSKRVAADEILHILYTERPDQTRGVSWFGAGIVPLKDFDEYEDATLLRQKIAACFAAFVQDIDGESEALGEEDEEDATLETFEPGMIANLPPGKSVVFGNPPAVTQDGFDARTLRRVAAALGVTYEDLTGDYSQVNFSSARMARLEHWGNVYDWQYNMLIPLLCDGVWAWFVAAAPGIEKPRAEWTPPPMPMIEPDKEGLAYQRLVRVGAMTPSEMVRERGHNPKAHWAEYAADLKELKQHGISLDVVVSEVTQAGQAQASAAGSKPPVKDEVKDES